jgi:hypothetical protein
MAMEVLALIGLFTTISGTRVSFVAVFMPATAWTVVLLCLAGTTEAVASQRAGRLRQPGHVWLERSFVGRTLVLPTVAATALLLATTKASIIAMTATCVLVGVARVVLWRLHVLDRRRLVRHAKRRASIRARLRTEGVPITAAAEPRAPTIPKATLLEIAARRAICTLLLLLVGLAIATNVEATITGRWGSQGPRVTHPSGGAGGRRARGAQAGSGRPVGRRGAGATGGGDTTPHGATGAGTTPRSTCPSIETAPNVSSVTIATIERLFTLAGSGSGGAIGCPTTVKVESTSQGPMYWSLSWRSDDPNPTAIAAIAPQQRRFVALAPAVAPIEKLILAHQPIGSEREFARYYAGRHGCVYVLLSDAGSTMITEESIEPGEPVVSSPPAVSAAIRSSDQQFALWLWPREPQPSGSAEVVYDLKADAAGPVVERVHYNPTRHTAWRGSPRDPIRYRARQKNLVIGELRTWIPEPAPQELQLEREIERDES